jgi:hypothetical protein
VRFGVRDAEPVPLEKRMFDGDLDGSFGGAAKRPRAFGDRVFIRQRVSS